MLGKKSRWIAPLAATAAVMLAASPASAYHTDPDMIIPASDSCGDFDLGLAASDGTIRVIELANGNIYQVGTGVILTWSNEENGATYTVKTSGSVARYVLNPDKKTYTLNLTGHNGFIYFSGDATGPGAYQYIGRVSLQVDANLTVGSVDASAGKAVDICARLR